MKEAALTWLVPTYRTGRFAEELSRRCAASAAALGLSDRMLFVDDQCPEESHRWIAPLVREERVALIRLPHRLGQDGAIREGLRHIAGPAVVLDGDLQDPPEVVERLWPALQEGFDAAFADRRGPYEAAGRRLTSVLYRRVLETVSGLPRGAGLFVLLGAETARRVADTRETPISILAALAATRGRFTSVPVERHRRREGPSGYSGRERLAKGLHSIGQAIRARHLGARL